MGGDIILLYILNGDNYKNYVKSNSLKYLPKFLLPKFKPMIIDSIETEDKFIGKIIGINIKSIDMEKKEQLDVYVDSIINLKTEEDIFLYIEEMDKFSNEYLNYIEEKSGLKFCTGDNIRIKNIKVLIKDVFKYLNQDFNKSDTLIVCQNKKNLIDIILSLSNDIRFITVIGIDSLISEEVYEEVLEQTGISIFQPSNIGKIIKNYGIIINYNDHVDLNLSDIRNNALIIDFSNKKPFKVLESTKKNVIYIEEINFKVNFENRWIKEYIPANLYESLCGDEKQIFSQIYTKNNFIFVKDLINSKIKIKGRV